MSVDDFRKGSSELRQFLTPELFEKIYVQFKNQADKNMSSRKANGSRTPYGITSARNNNLIDNRVFSQHFGQGAASKTPYISWYVVSIYYVVEASRVVMGIEEDRYPFLNKMKPLKYERIGNKQTNVAVFFESQQDEIDLALLCERFISLSEEVMRNGVQQ